MIFERILFFLFKDSNALFHFPFPQIHSRYFLSELKKNKFPMGESGSIWQSSPDKKAQNSLTEILGFEALPIPDCRFSGLVASVNLSTWWNLRI